MSLCVLHCCAAAACWCCVVRCVVWCVRCVVWCAASVVLAPVTGLLSAVCAVWCVVGDWVTTVQHWSWSCRLLPSTVLQRSSTVNCQAPPCCPPARRWPVLHLSLCGGSARPGSACTVAQSHSIHLVQPARIELNDTGR